MQKSFKDFKIPRELVEKRTSRSGGAGGQHVNKTESKVEIRFHIDSAVWLPKSVAFRLKKSFLSRINKEGFFVITCEESRSQHRNEEICFDKLLEMIKSCWLPPKKRKPTKPTRSSKEKRLKEKRSRSQRVKNRKIEE